MCQEFGLSGNFWIVALVASEINFSAISAPLSDIFDCVVIKLQDMLVS